MYSLTHFDITKHPQYYIGLRVEEELELLHSFQARRVWSPYQFSLSSSTYQSNLYYLDSVFSSIIYFPHCFFCLLSIFLTSSSIHVYTITLFCMYLDIRTMEEGNYCFTIQIRYYISVQFSRSVVSNSLRPHELQHATPPCPSPTPRVHSNARPSSQ